MDEYISREDVLKKAKSSISVPADNEWDCGYNTAMAEMQEFIKQLPSADVQPVKHGRWFVQAKCSECEKWAHVMNPYTKSVGYECCPHCNARMDGDTE